jgi:hypothetical protein
LHEVVNQPALFGFIPFFFAYEKISRGLLLTLNFSLDVCSTHFLKDDLSAAHSLCEKIILKICHIKECKFANAQLYKYTIFIL